MRTHGPRLFCGERRSDAHASSPDFAPGRDGLLRSSLILGLSLALCGCALALEGAALSDLGVGLAARGAAAEGLAGLVARGAAAEPVLLSDGLASSFRGARFSSAVRGSLSEGLARITLGGQRSAVLAIDRQLGISANGYTLARISKQTGEFYSAAGRRLGYVSREGLLVEYMTGGGARPIGAVRGLIRGSSAPVFADAASGRVIATLPTSGIVRITRFAQGGYWVELQNGLRGWLPDAAMLLIAVLGIDQKLAVCGAQPGAIVTKLNRLVEYERCKRTASGNDLVAQGQVLHVPADAVSEIWEGGVRSGASSSFRRAALHSLRVDGLIYPAHAEYRLFPQGDPRDRGVRAPNMMEAPE